jgi:RimJ/RimL family protein N-acetyltransferase
LRLETKRLELRSATQADAPHLQALFSDPEVLRFLPPGPPWTLDDARTRIERRIRLEAERGFATLIVLTRPGGTFVGSGGLLPVENTGDVELAYHLLPSAWGRGYATEAAIAILRFGFETAKLDTIVGVAFPENVASWKVMEKVGMEYRGLERYHGIDGVRKYVAQRTPWTQSHPLG